MGWHTLSKSLPPTFDAPQRPLVCALPDTYRTKSIHRFVLVPFLTISICNYHNSIISPIPSNFVSRFPQVYRLHSARLPPLVWTRWIHLVQKRVHNFLFDFFGAVTIQSIIFWSSISILTSGHESFIRSRNDSSVIMDRHESMRVLYFWNNSWYDGMMNDFPIR